MPEATRPGGRIRVIVGTNPAAGAEIVETVPAGVQWRLIAMQAGLVTDVTVINRLVVLVLDDGVNIFVYAGSSSIQAASQLLRYTFGAFSRQGDVLGGAILCGYPEGIVLGPGFRFSTLTINLQAGDNWGPSIYMVEEWPA